MKNVLTGAAMALVLATTAHAQTEIGVSIFAFDDVWTSVLRNAIEDYATEVGAAPQVEDAQNNVTRQLDQINNFIASGVDAIIVQPVDTSATPAITAAAAAAGIPLVYVNRQPVDLESLPDNQAFVASNEIESGTLQAFAMCQQLRSMGLSGGANAYIMIGDLGNEGALQRTRDVEEVLALSMCSFINVIDQQTANWQRGEAADLMTNWITTGEPFDAVFANNDEMALGAIQAMKAAGIDMADVVVGGVDATQAALAAIDAGDLDLTVFQDAAGQGKGAVDAALALVAGEEVDRSIEVPFQLVLPANVNDFRDDN